MNLRDQLLEATKRFLIRRSQAYRACLPKDGPMTRIVLEDLAKFCRAGKSTFHADPRIAAQLDGRREVFLRITQHLGLTGDELMEIYSAGLAKEK